MHVPGLGFTTENRRQRRGARAAVLLLAPFVAAACQTDRPALSLEQARHVAAKFESSSFTPPPRSIDGILAAIPEPSASNVRCLDAGLSDEEIRSMLSSFPLAMPGKAPAVVFAEDQADQQFVRGNYRRSIRIMQWGIDAVPDTIFGMVGGMYAMLSTLHAYAGDFEAADSAIATAESYVGRARITILAHIAYTNFHLNEGRAAIAQSKGRLREAEAYYRQALENGREASETFGRLLQRMEFTRAALARNLMLQGRLVEAEIALREVLQHRLVSQTRSTLVGSALTKLSEVFYEQGRYGDAAALARKTVGIYRAMCAAPESLGMAAAQSVLGKSLVAEGRWHEAFDHYTAIKGSMAKDPESFERLFAGDLYRALALLRAGNAAEAAAGLKMAFQKIRERYGQDHYRTAEIRGFLAMARYAAGERQGLLPEFASTVDVLLANARQADEESTTFRARDRRLQIILDAYIGLLADIRGTAAETEARIDAVAEAFRLAGVANLSSVQYAFSASSARAAVKDPALAELARREQDTQKQITALHATMAEEYARPNQEQSAARLEATKAAIADLRAARTALLKEVEARFPDYADLMAPKPATVAEARAALRPGEALISAFVGESRTHVWAIPKSGTVAFAVVPLGQRELSIKVAALRSALQPNARTLGDIPEFDLKEAYGLYKALLEPVAAGWRDAKNLLVVAHGPLGHLPLSLLPTAAVTLGPEKEPLFANYREVPWLARSHGVTVLPSVVSLRTLRRLPPGNDKRLAFAGFGDPLFREAPSASVQPSPVVPGTVSVRGVTKTRGLPVRLRAAPATDKLASADLSVLPPLPDTADEVRSIAIAMNTDLTKSIFVGKEASEGRVKGMDLSGFKVLAFATHGLVPGDLDGLTQPALALSSPKVVGGSDDGLLTMGEILGLKLDADWVVLSACNTGAGEGAGAEAVSGLGRAFFYAGTRALLVSNWPVETTSARALTTDLFRRQAAGPALSRAEALRQAMVGMIDGPGHLDGATGKTVYSYAHPLFWAPFTLVGDGGGAMPGS